MYGQVRRGEAVVLYEYVEVCKEDKVDRGAVPSPLHKSAERSSLAVVDDGGKA